MKDSIGRMMMSREQRLEKLLSELMDLVRHARRCGECMIQFSEADNEEKFERLERRAVAELGNRPS